ncbi:MAG: S8 family serine peptidase [Acidobacteria bacterium]|nr:S8 family serine peptidase [Acidobacteriota bacterium]MBI3657693.1 S8 family serine peptidase [Acidobacteriota bacterium]
MWPNGCSAKICGFGYIKLLILSCLFICWGLIVPLSGQDFVPKELVVSIRPPVDIYLLGFQYGFVPLEQLEGTRIWRVRTLRDLIDTLNRLIGDRLRVEFAELNYIFATPEAEQQSMAFVDEDSPPYIHRESPPRFFNQPAYLKIQADQAHGISTGQDIIVAVVDTGTSFTHPALSKRTLLGGWDFVDNDPDPTDEPGRPGDAGYGHGTFISGLITLIAPDAWILPLRALKPSGSGTSFNVARAVRYARDFGAHIINLSLGLTRQTMVVEAAIAYAAEGQVFVVASAGNQNTHELQYPASSRNVTGVAAVNNDDIKASFSNFNERISVSAPGVDIYSVFPGDVFASWSGTSFSAALVAGEAALVKALWPDRGWRFVQNILKLSSEDIYPLNPGYVGRLGAGRINCLSAVQVE